jgi:hypothetical protein
MSHKYISQAELARKKAEDENEMCIECYGTPKNTLHDDVKDYIKSFSDDHDKVKIVNDIIELISSYDRLHCITVERLDGLIWILKNKSESIARSIMPSYALNGNKRLLLL